MRPLIRRLPWHWLTVTAIIGIQWAVDRPDPLARPHRGANRRPTRNPPISPVRFDESITRTVEAVDQTLLFIREGYHKGPCRL